MTSTTLKLSRLESSSTSLGGKKKTDHIYRPFFFDMKVDQASASKTGPLPLPLPPGDPPKRRRASAPRFMRTPPSSESCCSSAPPADEAGAGVSGGGGGGPGRGPGGGWGVGKGDTSSHGAHGLLWFFGCGRKRRV